MTKLHASLLLVLRKVRNYKRVAAHEAYAMALTIYTLYRLLAAVDIPGAQQRADRLSERFAQSGAGAPPAGNRNDASNGDTPTA